MSRSSFVMCVLTLLLTVPTTAQIVDHADVDAVETLPLEVMNAVGEQRWLFNHASVGGNMVSGLNDLHAADAERYQLVTVSVSYLSAEQRAADPPTPTIEGTVYDCQRGNPGWSAKYTIFDNSVRVSGWSFEATDVAMDKLCYIDQNADAQTYITMMTALEDDFPDTTFVYTTMPLTTSEDAANILRNTYNDAVRGHCSGDGCLVYDIADMEAHDPTGAEHTFDSGGGTYQKLYAGYTSDGGHLNVAGRQRIAKGWYAVAAALVGGPDEGARVMADLILAVHDSEYVPSTDPDCTNDGQYLTDDMPCLCERTFQD